MSHDILLPSRLLCAWSPVCIIASLPPLSMVVIWCNVHWCTSPSPSPLLLQSYYYFREQCSSPTVVVTPLHTSYDWREANKEARNNQSTQKVINAFHTSIKIPIYCHLKYPLTLAWVLWVYHSTEESNASPKIIHICYSVEIMNICVLLHDALFTLPPSLPLLLVSFLFFAFFLFHSLSVIITFPYSVHPQ